MSGVFATIADDSGEAFASRYGDSVEVSLLESVSFAPPPYSSAAPPPWPPSSADRLVVVVVVVVVDLSVTILATVKVPEDGRSSGRWMEENDAVREPMRGRKRKRKEE